MGVKRGVGMRWIGKRDSVLFLSKVVYTSVVLLYVVAHISNVRLAFQPPSYMPWDWSHVCAIVG